MTKRELQEWFCLNAGRENFGIDPFEDREFLFGEATWTKEIDKRLQRAELSNRPVRLVWWGQYGIGKTHRLRHTQFLIDEKGYSFYPCYVVASDIQEKTGFEKLHVELINRLKRSELEVMLKSYLHKVRVGDDGVATLEVITSDSQDLQRALEVFDSGRADMIDAAWRFLSGIKIDPNERRLLAVTKNQLDSSNDFSGVICALGHIIHTETKKQLLYLIDEVENMGKVTNKTAEEKWRAALRALLDLNHVSMVVAIGAERHQDLPKIILQPDVVRRFERDNYVVMEAFKQPVVETFLRNLLEKVVDPVKVEAREKEKGLDGTPGYKRELFPFTEKAFQSFCEYAAADPRTAKPSEILARLNNIAADACLEEMQLIDGDLLTEMGIA